ncbi:uncharacterized protein LOC135222470 [Macrobrachium nipponense]|uniref:uncharacterized protein LOC135222470 n=1 Tax=Macrobrachium nipponense TaxID=159736 RepID=UPI0030C857A7
MVVLSEEISNEELWELLYDDLVITAENRKDLQRRVGEWQESLEMGDLKVKGKWKEVAGVVCDKKMPIKLKVKVNSTVIRPELMYGWETWALRRKEEIKLERTDGNAEVDYGNIAA